MKKLVAAVLLAGAALSAVPANAAEGCGRGYHRGPRGHCIANGRGPVVIAPGLVIGTYYRDRGYWDGQRYRHNRYRDHGNWRYR